MIIVTRETFAEAVEKLSSADILSVDTETTGLFPFNGDRLFSIQVSDSLEDYYFNYQDYFDDSPHVMFFPIKHLQPLFNNKLVFMQNAKFDMAFLYNEGIRFDKCKIHDTEVAGRIIRNDHLSYSLDEQSKRELGEPKDDAVMEWLKKNKCYTVVNIPGKDTPYKAFHFNKVPFDLITKYGCKDTRLTYDLGMKQLSQLEAMAQETGPTISNVKDVYEMEMNLVHTCFLMERNGIKIDVDYCKRAVVHEDARIAKAEKEFIDITGVEITDSGLFLGPIFVQLGFVPGTTATGEFEVTDKFLEKVNHPLGEIIREYRDARKRSNTYFKSFLHYVDARGFIHPNMRQSGTTTGRFSYRDPNCLSMDTEVLTRDGWVPGTLYSGQEVCSYKNGKLLWEKPSKVYKSSVKLREMVSIKNQHFDMRVTSNHRIIHINRKSKKELVTTAKTFPKDSWIIHGGLLDGNKSFKSELLRLVVAIQADAHVVFTKKNRVMAYFGFKKQRKINRILEILKLLHMPYIKIGQNRWKIKVDVTEVFDLGFLTDKKMFTFLCLELPILKKKIFFEELKFWDGGSTRVEFDYCSKYKQNIDVVQALSATIGYRCHVYLHGNKKNKTRAYVASFTRRNYSGTANVSVKTECLKEQVWCLEVSSGSFLVRRGSDTFITGNCQNLPSEDNSEFPIRRAFIPRDGFFFASLDYAQMEFRMMLDEAAQHDLINKIIAGHDPHTATAELTGLSRKAAKTLNFALLFGMGKDKLAGALGVSVEDAIAFKAKYFASLPMVENFILQCSGAVRTRSKLSPGNGWIKTWLGRRGYFNDEKWAYKAANFKIQGGAAETVKIAMNRIHVLLLDKKSRMVLQVHDELLLEISYDEVDVLSEIKKIMETSYPHRFLPLTCSSSYSVKSFYDLEEIDLGEFLGKAERDAVQREDSADTKGSPEHVAR